MRGEEFERLVAEALEELPEEFQKRLDNVDVVVAAEPTRVQRERAGIGSHQTLFGLYEGVPLTKRDRGYHLVLPDKITIFQRPMEAVCRTDEEIRNLVRKTVMHEIAHHFGIGDERLRELNKDG
ncbi:MAG: metallopeptidase family protein [Anaerolineae bacterium]|nr:metallopeptidase family protein [Anaerolineae bacterium]